MRYFRDSNNSLCVEWEHGIGLGGFRRAWIRKPTDPKKDWAKTGRYVSIAAIEALGSGPLGLSADFPVFNNLTDEEVLAGIVAAICGITGSPMPL